MNLKWRVSDVLDDGHNGIVREEDNGIVIGAASPLTMEQAQKICDIHNFELGYTKPEDKNWDK